MLVELNEIVTKAVEEGGRGEGREGGNDAGRRQSSIIQDEDLDGLGLEIFYFHFIL